MRGIDISGHQINLDFSKVKTDVVIIKATEGCSYKNPLLKLQYAKAKSIGCHVGFYHFLRTNNPTEEAKFFLEAIKGLESDCKYIIDCETEPSGANERVRQFAYYLKSQGKEPALYSGLSFYNDYLSKTDLPLWIAAYCKTRPSIKSIGWQYSDSLTIGGQRVDHNVFDTGILLQKGVDKMAKVDSKVLLLQKVANRVGIRGADDKPLVEDGLNGKNTEAARIKLIAYIAGVTK